MPDEKTPQELQAEKLEKARKANEERNQSRLDRMSAIADGNDEHGAADMRDVDGNKLVMKEEPTPEAREAAAAQEEMDAQKFLAEQEAKALQEAGAEPEPQEAKTEEEKPTEPTEPTDVKVVNGVTHYLTIVNGKEKWLTLEQLRVAAQKVESADEYLASAAASVRNSSRLAPSIEDEPSKIEEVDLEKTLSSAVMGDEEAIKKLAAAIKARPSAVTPDVLQQFDERWLLHRAKEWFEETYADELADPFLKRLVYDRDSELARDNPQLPYKQRFKQAGEEVRTWRKKLSGQAPIQATVSPNKLERKKVLVNVPSAAARQMAPEDEEQEESVEEAIQKIAQARGQARAFVHGRTNQR